MTWRRTIFSGILRRTRMQVQISNFMEPYELIRDTVSKHVLLNDDYDLNTCRLGYPQTSYTTPTLSLCKICLYSLVALERYICTSIALSMLPPCSCDEAFDSVHRGPQPSSA